MCTAERVEEAIALSKSTQNDDALVQESVVISKGFDFRVPEPNHKRSISHLT
jgi:hypothetical protein